MRSPSDSGEEEAAKGREPSLGELDEEDGLSERLPQRQFIELPELEVIAERLELEHSQLAHSKVM